MPLEIVSIEYLGITDDYVYDLETDDGTFASSSECNENDILLKNTDSCYVTFDIPKSDYTIDGRFDEISYMKETFRLSKECAQKISSIFKFPIQLEFEKVMFPFFLYQKKRYAYKEWIDYTKPNKVEFKGLSIVRRDYCPYIKEVCVRIFKILMMDRDIDIFIMSKKNKENEFPLDPEGYICDSKERNTTSKEEDYIIIRDKYVDEDDNNILKFTEVIVPFNNNTYLSFLNSKKDGGLGKDTKITTESYREIAMLYTRKVIADLIIDKTVPIEKLIISKSLKNTYKIKGVDIKWTTGLCSVHFKQKNKDQVCPSCEKCTNANYGIKQFFKNGSNGKQKECKECKDAYTIIPNPHVRIGNRLRDKDPINGPKPPDRVPYVYIYIDEFHKKKQHEFTVHPTEITKDMEIFYLYYFEHQLKNSIDQIFSVIVNDPSIMYNDLVNQCMLINNCQENFLNFLSMSKKNKDDDEDEDKNENEDDEDVCEIDKIDKELENIDK